MTQNVKVALWLILAPTIVLDVHGVKKFHRKLQKWLLELKIYQKMLFWLVLPVFVSWMCVATLKLQNMASRPQKPKNVQELKNWINRSWVVTFCLKYELGAKFSKNAHRKQCWRAHSHAFRDSTNIKVWKNILFYETCFTNHKSISW